MTAAATDPRLEDEWIAELTRRKWTHFYFPNREAPQAIASAYWHTPGLVDVVQLFGEADAFAYRAPLAPNGDPFSPTAVVWTYGGTPVWTIRATLALPTPGHPNAPNTPTDPPPMCRVIPNLTATTRAYVVRPPIGETRRILNTGRGEN